ncbi:MAG: XTP/dITP diphosphatase [Acidilobaceae archaeon]
MSRNPKIYIVTSNLHKGTEAVTVLKEEGVEADLIIDNKLEVQSSSLEEIALKAVRIAYIKHRVPLAVDDSGLFIEALNGFPGVYSNYIYKTIGISGILKLLEGEVMRKACFKTVVAAVVPPLEIIVHGEVCGEITKEPRGVGGFGFDPIFVPENHSKTFAEMSLEEKNAISHRGKAFRALARKLKSLWTLRQPSHGSS